MKWLLYGVHDSATEMYQGPFKFQADGQAMRWFEDACNHPESEIAKHPEYYSFFRIGAFDDTNGSLEDIPPKFLASGQEMVKGYIAPDTNLKVVSDEEIN